MTGCEFALWRFGGEDDLPWNHVVGGAPVNIENDWPFAPVVVVGHAMQASVCGLGLIFDYGVNRVDELHVCHV